MRGGGPPGPPSCPTRAPAISSNVFSIVGAPILDQSIGRSEWSASGKFRYSPRPGLELELETIWPANIQFGFKHQRSERQDEDVGGKMKITHTHLQASVPVRQTQGIMHSRHRFTATYTATGIDACAPNPRSNAFQASLHANIHTYRHRCLCAKPKE